MMYGFTENYVRVSKPFDEKSINQIEHIILDKIQEDGNVSVKETQFEDFLAKV
jgi:threonylcarbamoyladenosine tRNA methylthiotransferase MtaB